MKSPAVAAKPPAAFLLVLLGAALALAAPPPPHLTTTPNLAAPGPCGSQLTTLPFTLPASSNCSWRCSGVLYVHTPAAVSNQATVSDAPCPYAKPYPLIVITSGFLASASDYFAYSTHLASWGFAVLQYDFNLIGRSATLGSAAVQHAAGNNKHSLQLGVTADAVPAMKTTRGTGRNKTPSASSGAHHMHDNGFTHTDEAEVGFLPHFLALLESHPNTNPNPALNPTTNPLNGKLDLDNMGAAGHSRGGKIAALHFAGRTPGIKAAFLIDPVDGTTATAGQPGYPSAVDALRGQDKRLGLTGAGRLGPCNDAPFATGNWTNYWGVAASGSWLEIVPDAGHLQFADISSLLDLVCCRGCQGLLSHEEGIGLAKVPLTAYFHKELQHKKMSSLLHASDNSASGGDSVHASPGQYGNSQSSLEVAGHISTTSTASTHAPSKGWQLWRRLNPLAAVGRESTTTVESSGRHTHAGGVKGSSVVSVIRSFRAWVCEEEAAGKVKFAVKGIGDVCDGDKNYIYDF